MSSVNECRKLNIEERSLLATLKGSVLNSVDACVVAGSSTAWGGVRLHVGEDSVDVCAGQALAFWGPSEEDIDEFGCMSVAKGGAETLEIREASPQTTVIPVEKTVTEIAVIDEAIELFEGGEWAARVETTQAVALHLGDEWLLLDRECWFSDLITVKTGKNLDDMLYDDAPNWEVEPEERPNDRFEVGMTTTKL